MTVGQKLTFYRRKKSLTQQQLGDMLNISAQAVSKWENDQAEPDILTLKKLSEIYEVSLDRLVSEEDVGEEIPPEINAEDIAAKVGASVREQLKEAQAPQAIGFCVACGIAVTEENLGEKTPKVLCRTCHAAALKKKAELARLEAEAQRKDAELKERTEAAAKRRTEDLRARRKNKLTLSIVLAAIATVIVTTFIVIGASAVGVGAAIGVGIVTALLVFSFVSLLFFEGPVRDVIEFFGGASISWPGLIFSWDLDGFIWLIGMKLLFAGLGFLFGILAFLLGAVIGMIISPFVYPYFLTHYLADIRNGVEDSDWDLVNID